MVAWYGWSQICRSLPRNGESRRENPRDLLGVIMVIEKELVIEKETIKPVIIEKDIECEQGHTVTFPVVIALMKEFQSIWEKSKGKADITLTPVEGKNTLKLRAEWPDTVTSVYIPSKRLSKYSGRVSSAIRNPQ
jgi:hypothetical protein